MRILTFVMTFRALLELHGKTATGITVPVEVVKALGSGKRPPVVVTINDHSYRSTVCVMRGDFMLPVASEHRVAAKVNAGEEIGVHLELDTAPRTVEVPEDLASALAEVAGLTEVFDNLSFSNQKEHVTSVNDAKTAETRRRRVEKVIASLSNK